MTFSDRFLSALGGWQRGWRENAELRLDLAKELESAVNETDLPTEFRSVSSTCYRKRFLVPNNPQNGGDLGPLFLNGFLPEGTASWTTDKKFAQEFKDPIREGTFAAIFAHDPSPNDVLVNIPALWENPAFEQAVDRYSKKEGPNVEALLHFKFLQSEVVLKADLRYDELINICSRSSPFETLCELNGLTTDRERDLFFAKFVEADAFPEEPYVLSSNGTRAALDRAKAKFLAKHGAKIQAVLAKKN